MLAVEVGWEGVDKEVREGKVKEDAKGEGEGEEEDEEEDEEVAVVFKGGRKVVEIEEVEKEKDEEEGAAGAAVTGVAEKVERNLLGAK